MLFIYVKDDSPTFCDIIIKDFPHVKHVRGVRMSGIRSVFSGRDVVLSSGDAWLGEDNGEYDVVFNSVNRDTELYIRGMIAAHEAIMDRIQQSIDG
jgi:hypothetical protein